MIFIKNCKIIFLISNIFIMNIAFADIFLDVSGGWYFNVKNQLDIGISADFSDSSGDTLLHHAAKAGQLRIAQLLVGCGASINCMNMYGETPLLSAIDGEHFEMIPWLLEHGANPTATSLRIHNFSALHSLIVLSDKKLVELLVKYGADLNIKGDKGITPLLLAIDNNKFDIAEFLINSGALTDIKDEGGVAPLTAAVGQNSLSIVNLLLDHGADVNVLDNKNFSPLFYAVVRGNIDMVKLLVSRGANLNRLYVADKQANILHIACGLGRDVIVILLLDAGIATDCLTIGRSTPLKAAVLNQHVNIARLLLERSANMYLADETGKTPYDYALESKNKQLINLFEEYKEKQQEQVVV